MEKIKEDKEETLPKTFASDSGGSSKNYECTHEMSFVTTAGSTTSKNLMDDHDSVFFARTEKIVSDFESHLASFLEQKSILLSQLKEEKCAIIEKHNNLLISERQKHAACEENFRRNLEIERNKFKELNEQYTFDKQAFQDKVRDFAEELENKENELGSLQTKFEKTVSDKNHQISELQSEKSQLESRTNLEKANFFSQNRQLEERNRQLKDGLQQSEDEVKKWKSQSVTLTAEKTFLASELETTTKNFNQLKEVNQNQVSELEQLKQQLKNEQNLKQEKTEIIQSLTDALNENKTEIEKLRRNFNELELKRSKEIKEYELQLTIKQSNFEQELERLRAERVQIERQLKQEVANLERDSRNFEDEIERLKALLDQRNTESLTVKHQLESQLQKLIQDRDSSEETYSTTRLELQSKIDDTNRALKDAQFKYDHTQNELVKCQTQLATITEELEHTKNQIVSFEEVNGEYQMQLDKFNRLLQLEKVQKDEKSKQIESLHDQLTTSQLEIEKIKDTNEELLRSLKDGDTLRNTLIKDGDELRNTLSEVEKSRLELKSKLSTSVVTENRLKLKENEIVDLERRIETLSEEKRRLQTELESVNKSMTQIKQLNERLNQQNGALQKKTTQLEGMEFDRRLGPGFSSVAAVVTANSALDADLEKRRLKRTVENLEKRVDRVENEKRRIERSYATLEQKYSAVFSQNHFKSEHSPQQATSRPSAIRYTTQTAETTTLSLLSPSKLLNDTSLFGGANTTSSSKLDSFTDEALKVTKSIEALEKHHQKFTRKIQGLENLIEAASSKSGTGDDSTFDEEEIRQNFERLDYNANPPGHTELLTNEEKLKQAQIRAQNLIEASTMMEKELTKSARKQRSTQSPKQLEIQVEQ